MPLRTFLSIIGLVGAMATLIGQQSTPTGAQFDVVSIKPHPYDPATGGGMRTLPDGTFMMTSQPIWSVLSIAALEPVYEVTGFPDWVRSEYYNIIAKPAPDSHPTREERNQMMRNMLIDRFKLAGHIEEVDRAGFALVFDRADHRLGPQLAQSTLDCAKPSPTTPGPCGFRGGRGTVEAKGLPFERLVLWLKGPAEGPVTDRTGLTGLYDWSLRFSPPRLSATPASDDAPPQLFTALQEQLGLKLVPEKTKVKIFVIDHIEKPTPD